MSALDTTTESSVQKPPRRSRHPSTASIRSTASTRSPRPSVWRPPNSLRIRNDSLSSATGARISCVVAGAEIAGTAESVRERMEALNVPPAAGPSSPAPSMTSELAHEISIIPEAEPDATVVVKPDSIAPAGDGTNLVAFPVSVSPPASRSSTWFGSLSRAKGKEVQAVATASTPNLLAPASSIPIPVPDAQPSMSEPVTSSSPIAPERPDPFLQADTQPIAVQKPVTDTHPIAAQKAAAAKRSWFSSSPSQPSPLRVGSPPQPIPHPIRIPSTPPEQSSVPSSIDSSVPLPVATPPADSNVSFPLSEEGHDTVRGRQRLASLNPSMGRFGINLPLLGGGRATNPSTGSAEGTSKVSTDTTTYTSETLVQDSMDTLQTTTTTTTTTTNTTSIPRDETTTRPPDMSTDIRIEQYSSWWDYVGWGGAPQSTARSDTTEDGDVTPKPSQQPFLEVPNGEALNDDATAQSSDDDNTETLSPAAVPVISISHEQQASWYYPWAWYGSTSSSISTVEGTAPIEGSSEEKPNESEAAAEPNPTPGDGPAPDAAESTATAAQQRYWTSFFSSSSLTGTTSRRASESRATVDTAEDQTPSETAPAPSSDSATTSGLHPMASSLSLGSNPIGDSINSNRTGWVSFFSSSGTLGYVPRKAVTSGEPEVMDIDSDDATDEGEAAAEIASAPVLAAAQNETTDKAKQEPAGKQIIEGEKPQLNGNAPSAKPAKPATSKQPAPPLTISDSVKRQVANNSANSTVSSKRAPSPSPSVASKLSVVSTGTKTPGKAPSIAPPRTPTPNLVLPAWADTFHAPPRSVVPQRLLDGGKTVGRAVMEKTMKFVSGVLFASDSPAGTRRSSGASANGKGKDREEREREKRYEEWGLGLPRAWDVLKPAAGKRKSGEARETGEGDVEDVLRGCKHVVVIGIHGFFPGAVIRTVLGEPTGTSTKFVNMMVQALEEFQTAYDVTLDKITRIPLEGEGTIDRRVEKLYTTLTSNDEWMADVHAADVIFVATHSQGSVVSTHILDRLIKDGHIRTGGPDVSRDPGSPGAAIPSTFAAAALPPPPPQRVCCLALCGIHLGPLRYLSSSSLVLPYIQYFESAAARELFEFQNTESEVSKAYVNALRHVVDNGTKMVYVASLNDQVVPLYSGLFTAASHPLILRALYIDGDAYSSSDFLSNLLVLLLRVLNSGLPDSGLIAHLSEATAGSLNGVGHSTAYEEVSTYSLAVKYLFLTNSGFDTHPKLTVEPFNAGTEQNDYEIPWSLRDLIADERVAHFFSKEISQLAAAFRHWHPKTTILRDIKRKLQPIQRLPPSFALPNNSSSSVSKL